ncbi:MAG: Cof-type HAD-IIB family hydrolase [Bacillota bacterium]
MSTKIVGLDLDGTLLNQYNEITIGTKKYIKKLQENDIKVVIATGRTFTAAKRYHNELNLKTPLISCNGGFIYNPLKNEVMEGHEIDFKILKKIFTLLEKENSFYQYYTDQKIYSKEYKYLLKEWKKENESLDKEDKIDINIIDNPLNQLKDKDPIFKILIIEKNKKKYKKLYEFLEKIDCLEIVSSFEGAIDIMVKGITKGNALKNVSKYLNIDFNNSLAIGDNDNDATMLKMAKIGIAMENGSEKAKINADFITTTNNNNGVLKALKKYINIK